MWLQDKHLQQQQNNNMETKVQVNLTEKQAELISHLLWEHKMRMNEKRVQVIRNEFNEEAIDKAWERYEFAQDLFDLVEEAIEEYEYEQSHK